MNHHRIVSAAIGILVAGLAAPGHAQLEPPGPPGSAAAWMKPLNMVEPRTIITNLPCSISTPGSYYLISNLVGHASANGITILCGDVKLDLNGFALVGVAGSSNGIYVSGTTLSNITIQNGAIRSWEQYGIRAEVGRGIEVSGVKTCSNKQDGMWLGDNALVRECISFDNSAGGMHLGVNAVVVDCQARNNTTFGMEVDHASKVRGCVSFGNTQDGILASSNCTISACSAVQNKGDGIRVGDNCRVDDNNCSANGAGSGTGAGIHAVGTRSRIQNNNVTVNDYGIWTGQDGNLVIHNSAGSNGSSKQDNYNLTTGTLNGRIEVDLVRDFSILNPWANFSY